MSTLNKIITFEYENEHVLEHDLQLKRQFSAPKIYTAKGDLKKRWYVYFSFRNPRTDKLERMKNIYGRANNFKTKEARLSVLTTYRKSLLKLLKEGYSPFEDNTALFESKRQVSNEHTSNALNKSLKPSESNVYNDQKNVTKQKDKAKTSIEEAFTFALKIKKQLISQSYSRTLENRAKNFKEWLKEAHSEKAFIDDITKAIIAEYLNTILENTSARNRNNYRIDLSNVMQVLEDNDIIKENVVKKIPVLKTQPKRHEAYTKEQEESIFKYLREQDPILLLYIQFISYNFLRPIEVCRLKIGDIDLEHKTIKFKAKNSPLKTKIIPEILIKELPDLSNRSKDDYLFTPQEIGGQWQTSEDNRRNYFSQRYRKVVKDHFNLSKNQDLYSFRHTFITKLYRQMRKKSAPFEAKSKLMLITGHSSMPALEKYLRTIDAELPEDYSKLLQ